MSTSTDGGRTFGRPGEISGLPDPGVNADEIGVRDSHLLFSNPASTTERTNLTVRGGRCGNST